MKKLLAIVFLSLILSSTSFAVVKGYKLGKGPLKITKNTADVLEYYFSGGKKGFYAEKQEYNWKPGLIAISEDGVYYSLIRHPLSVTHVDNKNYVGKVIQNCQKDANQECFLFANGYKIVWDNGSNKKKRKLKRKDIKAGNTIALLKELGFYDGPTTSSSSTKSKNTSSENSSNVVENLNELNDLYKSGALTKEEFEKAKKKILNWKETDSL